jgi:hypothetical protein
MKSIESPESLFIQGQIALVRNECRQIREFQPPRAGLQELYERPFQHVCKFASFYRERGVTNTLLFAYLKAIENLEAAITRAKSLTSRYSD